MQTGLCRSEPSLWPGPSPRRAKDAAQARRLLAIAAVFDGASRTEAAKIGGKLRVFRVDGKLGVSAGLRGGAGETRTSNQTIISR
jgi:hypothetical protein